MLKNRLSYIAFAVVIAILMFFFSSPFMLYVLAAQAVLTVAVKLLIVGDSKSVNTEFKIKHGACEGRYITAEFKVISEKNLFATDGLNGRFPSMSIPQGMPATIHTAKFPEWERLKCRFA